MKRVAPELDGLMWTLAEEGNDRAIDEFGARHPELRSELLRRIAMVKGLRGEKKRTIEAPKAIPRFVPKETKTTGPNYVVGGLVLAALCAFAFAVTIFLTPSPRVHSGDVPNRVAPVAENQPPPRQDPAPQTPNEPVVNVNPPTPAQKEADEKLKPGTLKVEHAPLLTVLQMMADVCGVEIIPAPGMPNPDVVVDYRDLNAMQMLQDLGKQYGFTPMDQHDGSIIVIPAVEAGDTAQNEVPTGSNSMRKVGG